LGQLIFGEVITVVTIEGKILRHQILFRLGSVPDPTSQRRGERRKKERRGSKERGGSGVDGRGR